MAQHHDHDDRDPPFDAAAFLKAQQPEPFDGPSASGNLPDALKEFFNAPRRVRTEQETIEDGAWFSVWCEIDSIKQQIREIEITRTVSVTEILSSRAALKELHAERARLMAAMDKGEFPATAPSTAAQVKDSASNAPDQKEQRQDSRLQACIDAGLPMNTKTALLRLPDGVGAVADKLGLTRQAFSADVKAALQRRETAKRDGDCA